MPLNRRSGRRKMQNEITIPKVLRCFLWQDSETGRWLARCLDFDIATSGKDEDRAWKHLSAVVRLHVEHCFTHWQDGLKFRASDDDIALFDAMKKQQDVVRTEKITFNLVPPQKLEHLSPLWMQGIELTQGASRALATGSPIQ